MEKQCKQNYIFIKNINNINVLRDLVQLYQNEHSNFIADFNNINAKLSNIFNLASIFLGYFLTVIFFMFDKHYFEKFENFKILISAICLLFLILLIIFIFRTFCTQKFKQKYMKLDEDFPITKAYVKKFFEENSEREFLKQILYNLYKNNKINNSNLELLTKPLKNLHIEFIVYVLSIILSILGILIIGK